MFIMNKVLIYILVFLFCSFRSFGVLPGDVSRYANQTIIVKGDWKFPPYEYLDNHGDPAGFNVDMMEAIMRRLGLKYKIELEDWADVNEQLKGDKEIVLMGLMYSTSRAEYMIFGIPHNVISQGIAYRKDNPVMSPADFEGKSIIVQKNDRAQEFLEKNDFGSKVILSSTMSDGLNLLASGKYDAVMGGCISLYSLMRKHKYNNVLIKSLDVEPQYYSIAINKRNYGLMYLFDMALYQMMSDGEFDRIYNKWFGVYEETGMSNTAKMLTVAAFVLVILIVVFFVVLRMRIKVNVKKLNRANFEAARMVDTLKRENAMRRETEIQLSYSESKFLEIFDSLTDAIFIFDESLNNLVDCNKAATSLVGYSDKKTLLEGFELGLHEQILNRVEMVLKSENDTNEQYAVGKDGTQLWLEVNVKKCTIDDYNRILVSVRDIRDRKQAEMELIKAKEQAENSDSLKATFLTILSHEIRTPMNSIMGFTSLLFEENDPDVIKNYVPIVFENAEILADTIDKIVIYSGLQSGLVGMYVSSFSLRSFINNVKNRFASQIESAGSTLVVETKNLADEDVFLTTDEDKLMMIMECLISNAVKFTEKGNIKVYCEYESEKTLFSVSDTGIGISENEMLYIYDPFFRGTNFSNPNIRGAGLGLSIVQKLVSMFSGVIWVENNADKGCCFHFTITNVVVKNEDIARNELIVHKHCN